MPNKTLWLVNRPGSLTVIPGEPLPDQVTLRINLGGKNSRTLTVGLTALNRLYTNGNHVPLAHALLVRSTTDPRFGDVVSIRLRRGPEVAVTTREFAHATLTVI